jgi:hypothetical protein
MKHYKRPNSSPRGFEVIGLEEDGSQDHVITEDMVSITDQEADALRAPIFILADAIAKAITEIDSFYETLYNQSVANTAIGQEYTAAYNSAKAWLVDTTQEAPERIKALSELYGCTNAQAAGVVVSKWTEAQNVAFDKRGAARLRAKITIRAATDETSLATALSSGKSAMSAIVFSV